MEACFRRTVKKRAAFKMAEQLESQGRFNDAVRVALPVADQYPDDDVAQVLVGRLFAQMGEFKFAEEALRRARQLAPQKVQPHYLLSLLLTQEGQKLKQSGDKGRAEALFREAVALARETLSIKADYGFAHMALGLAYKELGQSAEARAALESAVRGNPEYAEMHLHLAEILDESKCATEAEERYQQALRLAAPGTPWRARVEARLADLKRLPKK
jgi:tetratricopeptide (TPR) repeat protein